VHQHHRDDPEHLAVRFGTRVLDVGAQHPVDDHPDDEQRIGDAGEAAGDGQASEPYREREEQMFHRTHALSYSETSGI